MRRLYALYSCILSSFGFPAYPFLLLTVTVEAQQEVQFAEVTAAHRETAAAHPVGITIHIGGAAVDVHGGADMATLERVLRMLKSC